MYKRTGKWPRGRRWLLSSYLLKQVGSENEELVLCNDCLLGTQPWFLWFHESQTVLAGWVTIFFSIKTLPHGVIRKAGTRNCKRPDCCHAVAKPSGSTNQLSSHGSSVTQPGEARISAVSPYVLSALKVALKHGSLQGFDTVQSECSGETKCLQP